MKKRLFWSCLTVLVVACATAPGTYKFSNNQAYSRSYDEIWEDLVRFFASRNIQIKNIAKDSGAIFLKRLERSEAVELLELLELLEPNRWGGWRAASVVS